ncbi:hypothetical protein HMPREF9554_01710 [Treponema phagedenis F0421]|nr:hypothetical protein HMPREF9554_01710 [Treponema phagedenis F0421]
MSYKPPSGDFNSTGSREIPEPMNNNRLFLFFMQRNGSLVENSYKRIFRL